MSRTCLIADASLMVRRVAARIVRELGYDVVEARTGVEALDIIRLGLPDVVLMDWQLGEVSAPEFIDAVRGEPGGADTHIILCTANRDLARITDALAAGASEYIMKPFDSDIIESKFRLAGLPIRKSAAAAA